MLAGVSTQNSPPKKHFTQPEGQSHCRYFVKQEQCSFLDFARSEAHVAFLK